MKESNETIKKMHLYIKIKWTSEQELKLNSNFEQQGIIKTNHRFKGVYFNHI